MRRVAVEVMGTCHIQPSIGQILRLYKVLYFIKAIRHIIFVCTLCKLGYNIQFNENERLIFLKIF